MTFDALVLAGGRGRRLGGVSKPEVRLAGRTLLDRALEATAGARRTVVVGPAHLGGPGVVTVLEDPPSGGPVAGIDAGCAALGAGAAGATTALGGDRPILVLACDVPFAAPAVPLLLGAVARDPSADGAHLVRDGRPRLVAVFRPAPLRAALEGLRSGGGAGSSAGVGAGGGVHGLSVRRLLARLRMTEVDDPEDLGADADTWDDVRRLEFALARRETMTAETPTDLDRWVQIVARALDVDSDVIDRDLVLDLSRDIAHTVTRPAVPLTAFLLGYAVGVGGGGRAELETVAARVAELNARWGAEHGSP